MSAWLGRQGVHRLAVDLTSQERGAEGLITNASCLVVMEGGFGLRFDKTTWSRGAACGSLVKV